ncbi:MAG TPA: ABC transporter permease [Steroidobacteraceae bacterium]|nr:ABC transporter permease [Steroidobacteraceae bacterium]
MRQHLATRRSGDTLDLELSGEWRVTELAAIDAELAALDLAGVRYLNVNTERLGVLDFSAAWRLRELLQRVRQLDGRIAFQGPQPEQLHIIDETLARSPYKAPESCEEEPGIEPVEALGRTVVGQWQALIDSLAFSGRVVVTLLRGLASVRRLRPISIARHVWDTGITAVPIVSLIAFLISVIIAYMSAQQLQQFGADVFVVDLVTIGVLRELGVLLTAIIVAGRSGSAFAAEIGAMQLNEEVDALKATGVDPFEVLVLPRIIGLVIALPLLTVIADAIGLTGGALLCRYLLDMPLTQYLERVNDAIAPTTFWVGIIKAPVFAVLIAMAGVYRGMQVRDSSRELGRLTTMAVVQSIFLVILADALFAVLFMELDI